MADTTHHAATVPFGSDMALHHAIQHENLPDVQQLLEAAAAAGPPAVANLLCSASIGDGLTPLQRAVSLCNVELVEQLLSAGADPLFTPSTAPEGLGCLPPLHLAAEAGSTDARIAQLLIAQGGLRCVRFAPVHLHGSTALHVAAREGHEQIVLALLKAGADPNARKEDGDTPLHDALWSTSEPVVKVLLQHGANVLATGKRGMSPLEWAVNKGMATALLPFLGEGQAALSALWRAAKNAAECSSWDTLAIFLKEFGRRDPRGLIGMLDELTPQGCRKVAPAIIKAWLADVSTVEQQQQEIKQQRLQLQEDKRNLQHLFVATACALREHGNLSAQPSEQAKQ